MNFTQVPSIICIIVDMASVIMTQKKKFVFPLGPLLI